MTQTSVTSGADHRFDAESARWVTRLLGDGPQRDSAVVALHALLLRVCRSEVHRRAGRSGISGADVDDLAQQAADDAAVALLAKVAEFRGDSKFTTWAFTFGVFSVSSTLGRHAQRRGVWLTEAAWEKLPDRLGAAPHEQLQARQLTEAIRKAIEHHLTERQRQVFVAIVVNGVPLDAVVAELGTNRNAVYKMIFDARRKIREYLVANGYMETTGDNRQGGRR